MLYIHYKDYKYFINKIIDKYKIKILIYFYTIKQIIIKLITNNFKNIFNFKDVKWNSVHGTLCLDEDGPFYTNHTNDRVQVDKAKGLD